MRAAAILIALVCVFAGLASAQSTDATITGRVLGCVDLLRASVWHLERIEVNRYRTGPVCLLQSADGLCPRWHNNLAIPLVVVLNGCYDRHWNGCADG